MGHNGYTAGGGGGDTRKPRRFYYLQGVAHAAVSGALLAGVIVRASICERCQKEAHTVGHHENYARPLEIVWLCRPCHSARHVELRREQYLLTLTSKGAVTAYFSCGETQDTTEAT